MVIDASGLGYAELNEKIRASVGTVKITGCLGQRFIGAGMSDKSIEIEGIPGNAMGAYLNGANITTSANAQDAVGDTMNDGSIVIRGTVGDAVGYAMRGGQIYVEKNAGYRAGIHMKEYKDKKPVIVIGGRAGSFLGEYQAGGIIIVLGLNDDSRPIVGNFPCTGMHGGKVFLRTDPSKLKLPKQVSQELRIKATWSRQCHISSATASFLAQMKRRCFQRALPSSLRTAKIHTSRCMFRTRLRLVQN